MACNLILSIIKLFRFNFRPGFTDLFKLSHSFVIFSTALVISYRQQETIGKPGPAEYKQLTSKKSGKTIFDKETPGHRETEVYLFAPGIDKPLTSTPKDETLAADEVQSGEAQAGPVGIDGD